MYPIIEKIRFDANPCTLKGPSLGLKGVTESEICFLVLAEK